MGISIDRMQKIRHKFSDPRVALIHYWYFRRRGGERVFDVIAGMLTTAGRLLFTADNSGNLLALNPASGETLWHLNMGGALLASPMTYQLDGRQYVILPVDDVLYALALAQK